VSNPQACRCAVCRGRAELIETRPTSTGRRRRYRCLDPGCGNRWTEWTGGRPRQGATPGARLTATRHRPPLTPEEVRTILISPLSLAAVSRLVGCSKQAAHHIRTGRYRADLWPEIPRRVRKAANGPSCERCLQWSGRLWHPCGLGFPDPVQEGPGFAADCSVYDEIR